VKRPMPDKRQPVTYRDRDGVAIRAGDIVRVVGVPDLSRMHPDARTETKSVFRHLRGKARRRKKR
jgi:hypothetical protein